jgi:hypothetical protein
MRYKSGNHTIQLEYRRDFDKIGWEAGGRRIVRAWSAAYPCYFDEIGPTDKESRVVLPVEIAFE